MGWHSQILCAVTQQRFQLRIPFQTLGEAGHLSGDTLSGAFIAASFKDVVLIAKSPPRPDKMISAELRLGPISPFPFHAPDGVGGFAGGGFVQ